MLPSESVSSISASLSTLKADPDAIEQVTNALNQAIESLSVNTYPVMGRIGDESFGTTMSATNLTFHHGLAHTVVSDMLDALGQDLQDLATNLAKAAQGVTEADLKAGEDVKAKQAIIETLAYSGNHDRATSRYNYDRNHPGQGAPASAGSGNN